MAVPSEEEFSDFISLVNGINAQELVGPKLANRDGIFQKSFLASIEDPSPLDMMFDTLTLENIELFFSKIFVITKEKDALRAVHPVQIWLNQQPCFNLGAVGYVIEALKGIDRFTWDGFCKKEVLSILDFDPQDNSVSYQDKIQLEELHEIIQEIGHFSPLKWLGGVVSCLRYYYYFSDLSDDFDECFEMEQQSLLRHEKEALNAARYLLNYMNSNDSKSVRIRTRGESIDLLERLCEDLDVDIKLIGIDSPIVKRGDRTKRERRLIHGLWKLLRTERSRGVTAILHFLSLEGIENQQDARTIQRMIARWEKQEVEDDSSRSNLAEEYPDTWFGSIYGDT